MPALLTSDGLSVQILFSESVAEVAPLLQKVVRQRETIILMTDETTRARFVNLAELRQFEVVDYPEQRIGELDGLDIDTVQISILAIEYRED